MGKRFTDTEKWRKEWFLELSPVHKCFWSYLLDNCSAAGIWDVNFRLASFQIGENLKESEVRETFKRHFVEFDGGKRWHIPDFVAFQYGELSDNCKPHAKVISELKRFGILKGMDSPTDLSSRVQEQEEEKEIKGGAGGRASRPTREEAKALFREKGFPAEAEKFFDYYESNGWRVGKNPMKNWRSAAANWLRNGNTFGKLESKPLKREPKPDLDHDACGGKGWLDEKNQKKCWCWK